MVGELGWGPALEAGAASLGLSPPNLPPPIKKNGFWSSHYGSEVTNLTSIHEDLGLIPGLTQWVKELALP